MTLAFFAKVAPELEEKLRENLRAIWFAHFFLPLQGLGTFPPKGSPKILWLGVGRGHPHLFQLHKRVADAALGAGLEPDLRPWHPHFTLARCDQISRGALEPFLRANGGFDAGLVPFSSFHLKSSRPSALRFHLHNRAERFRELTRSLQIIAAISIPAG